MKTNEIVVPAKKIRSFLTAADEVYAQLPGLKDPVKLSKKSLKNSLVEEENLVSCRFSELRNGGLFCYVYLDSETVSP